MTDDKEYLRIKFSSIDLSDEYRKTASKFFKKINTPNDEAPTLLITSAVSFLAQYMRVIDRLNKDSNIYEFVLNQLKDEFNDPMLRMIDTIGGDEK